MITTPKRVSLLIGSVFLGCIALNTGNVFAEPKSKGSSKAAAQGQAKQQGQEAKKETSAAPAASESSGSTAAKPSEGAATGSQTSGSTQPSTSEAAPAPVTASAPATSESKPAKKEEQIDAATYSVRLRDLEQKMNQLKDDIFRSKARLSLLSETVLHGVVSGSQAIITHENQMSNSFRLVKAVYALDGAPIYSRADEEGLLLNTRTLEVYNGSIVPGEHTLTVTLEYRGHGYGVFSYLKGYRFRVRSAYTFTAQEGKGVGVNILAYEKGGPTTPLEQRPNVKYIERETSRGDLSVKP